MFTYRHSIRLFTIAAMLVAGLHSVVAQNKAWDNSFVLDDSFFVIGLNVEALIEKEPQNSELVKGLAREFKETTGVNIEQLRQVQFVMGGSKVNSEEDVFEIKFLFNADQDFAPLIEKLFGRNEHVEAKHAGKTYLQSDRKGQPSYYMPDKQTFVLANEVRLLKLIESQEGSGRIADMLTEADGQLDAFAGFVYTDELENNFIAEIAREVRELPFDLKDIASEAKFGTLAVDLDETDVIVAHITTKDDEGAQRLKGAAEALLALGKMTLPMGRKELEREFPKDGDAVQNEPRASLEELLDAGTTIVESTSVSVEDDQLTVQTKTMGGLVEAARALAQFSLTQMKREREMRAEFREKRGEIKELK
jgi:hypothetical protein